MVAKKRLRRSRRSNLRRGAAAKNCASTCTESGKKKKGQRAEGLRAPPAARVVRRIGALFSGGGGASPAPTAPSLKMKAREGEGAP